MNEIEMLLYYSSPEYTKPYQDGYEACRQDMLRAIKNMKALYEETTTTLAVSNE